MMTFCTCSFCRKVPSWSCFPRTLTIVGAYPDYGGDDDDDDDNDDDDADGSGVEDDFYAGYQDVNINHHSDDLYIIGAVCLERKS